MARPFLSKSRLISAWSERARALTNKTKWMVALAGLLTMTMSVLAADLAPMLTFESEYPLGDTKVYAIHSEEAGRDLQMMVSLPGDYDSSGPETHYPVLYAVDGQWHHALLGAALGALHYDRSALNSIVVSVTWKGDVSDAERLRFEDLTPTPVEEFPNAGRADKFLDFMELELIPHVEETYRVSEDRALIGSSLGGLYTIYALFTRPSLFTDYIATSPSVGWDDMLLSKHLDGFADTGLDSKVRLYLARGGLEIWNTVIDDFARSLQARNIENLEVDFEIIDGAGHGSVNPEAYTRGLHYIFKKERVVLDEAFVQDAVGDYGGGEDFPVFRVTANDGRLQHSDSINNIDVDWITVADNRFFVDGQNAEASFVYGDEGHISGLDIDAPDRTFSLSKLDSDR